MRRPSPAILTDAGRRLLCPAADASRPLRRAVPREPAHRARPRLLRPHRLRVRHRQARRAGHGDGRRPLRRPGRGDGRPADARVGWAAGIERLAMLLDDRRRRHRARSPWCRSATRPRRRRSTCCRRCARAGIRAEMAYRGNLRRRMERANRIGARAAVILGDDDIAARRGAGEGPRDRRHRRRCRSRSSPTRLR